MPAQRPGIVCTGGIIAGLQEGHIHALMVAGGLVRQHAPGGDWKRVDWDALAAWLGRYGYKVADCETEALPTADASRRLREWERKGKNASSLNQRASIL